MMKTKTTYEYWCDICGNKQQDADPKGIGQTYCRTYMGLILCFNCVAKSVENSINTEFFTIKQPI